METVFKMGSIQESKKDDSPPEASIDLPSELVKLQRQYRLLVDDRKAYRNETEHTLKRQGQEIENLKREESDLMKDMNLVTQRSNHVTDKKNLEHLNCLLDDKDMMNAAVEEVNAVLSACQEEMKLQERKIEVLEKEIGGQRADQERHKATQKSICMMENRLDQATVKLNKTLARNASQRQEIEYITVQRRRFSDLHKKLRIVYNRGIQEKNELIESSKSLFTSREEAEIRMRNLKEKAERDLINFNAELRDLIRIIDNENRLKEFIKTKETDLCKILNQSIQARKDKKLATHVKQLQSEIELYDEIFQHLFEVSGDSDFNSMVNHFIATDDKNFALFNFVNEQEMQKKHYENDIEALKSETVALGKLNCTLTTGRKKIISELEERFRVVSQHRTSNNSEDKSARKTLEWAKTNIFNLFHKCDCDVTDMVSMLGNSEINTDNLTVFLGEIEKKTYEFLQIKLMLAIKENNEFEISLLQDAASIGSQQEKTPKMPNMPPSVMSDFQPLCDEETKTTITTNKSSR